MPPDLPNLDSHRNSRHVSLFRWRGGKQPPFGAYVPAPGPYTPMPYYFSGTNCRASGRVIPGPPPGGTGPQGITSATLYINNVATASYVYPGGSSPPAEIALSVLFDSKQFANGSITVRIDAVDLYFQPYSGSNTSTVKNRALIYEHSDFDDGAETVSNCLTGANYQKSIADSNGWTSAQLFADTNNCALLYVASHGTAQYHTNDGTVSIYPMHSDGPPNYEDEQKLDVGTGLPPFNFSQNTPIYFGYIFSCNTGDTNSFNRMCWPYQNYYGDSWIDQCILVYSAYVNVQQPDIHAELVFAKLTAGHTVLTAQSWLVANAADSNLLVKTNANDNWRTLTSGDICLYGDPCTRIKSVYTGSNVSPIGWWRL